MNRAPYVTLRVIRRKHHRPEGVQKDQTKAQTEAENPDRSLLFIAVPVLLFMAAGLVMGILMVAGVLPADEQTTEVAVCVGAGMPFAWLIFAAGISLH